MCDFWTKHLKCSHKFGSLMVELINVGMLFYLTHNFKLKLKYYASVHEQITSITTIIYPNQNI